jgi:hypothetical protein
MIINFPWGVSSRTKKILVGFNNPVVGQDVPLQEEVIPSEAV